MKELTIEEKAERYEKALVWMQNLYPTMEGAMKEDAEHYFPELCESKDEKIRKELLEQIAYIIPNDDEVDNEGNTLPTYQKRIDKYRTWLEEQGEPNPYSGVFFKYNDHTWGMCARDNGVDILLDKQLFKHLEKQNSQILANSTKTCEDEQKSTDKIESIAHNYITPNQQFFQWIYDRLINVHNEDPNVDYMLSLKERIKDMQKPAWSKEDEDYYDAIIAKLEVTQEDAALTDNQMNFLKFLKDRVKPKQEWSEEDENILRTIISDVIRGAEIDMLQINWLKAIKKRVACEAKCTTKKEWSKEVEIWIDRACMLLDELNHLSTLTLAKIPSNVNDIISHLKSLKDRIGG